MDDRRLLFDAQKFKKRMDGLNRRIDELEKRGDLPDPLAFLSRDSVIAWASGETAENWTRRTAVTEKSVEKLKEVKIWPWKVEEDPPL